MMPVVKKHLLVGKTKNANSSKSASCLHELNQFSQLLWVSNRFLGHIQAMEWHGLFWLFHRGSEAKGRAQGGIVWRRVVICEFNWRRLLVLV